jgi:uncharacterized protein with FMN-binding domain
VSSASTVGASVRRTLLLAAGTAAGLVLVLTYRTPTSFSNATSSASQSAGVVGSAPQRSQGSTTTQAPETVTGSTINTQFGPVQVQVTAKAGSLTEVRAVALPSGDPTSARISDYAGPQLQQQALSAQSASLDGVAGASYTSEGFRQSLQSALNQLSVAS